MTDQTQAPTYSPTTVELLKKFWTIDNIMAAWVQAETKLQEVKLDEMLLRKAVFEVKFPNIQEGTHRVPLANGYQLKAVGKLNYKLANKQGETEKVLEELEKTGNKGAFLADRLVKWSPELSITEYRQLDPQYKTIIDKVLTVTPGAPTLEIEEPKVEK